MSKKKAIKIATATAVAASAFAAVAPIQKSEAAVNYDALVKNSKDQLDDVYRTYSDVSKGQFASYSKFTREYNQAVATYKSVKGKLQASNVKNKAALLASLEYSYDVYINQRANSYIEARTAIVAMTEAQAVLEASTKAGDLAKTEEAYNTLTARWNAANAKIGKVYGVSVRGMLREYYSEVVQDAKDEVIYEVTVYVNAKRVEAAVTAGKLDDAKKYLDAVNLYLPKTDAEGPLYVNLAKVAKDAADKYEATQTPKVLSVSATNLKEVVVKFNKDVDATDATNPSNFLYDGLAVSGTPELQDDNKTVIITLATAATNKTAHTIKVQNVKTADGKSTITSDVFSYFINDTVNAEVKSATVLASGSVEVTFSEPLKTAPTVVRVNGIPVSTDAFVAGATTVTIPASQITSVAEGATASLYIAGATDFADLEAKTFEGSFVKVVDKVKPSVVSVTQTANQTFQVTFSENLGSDQLAGADITLIDKNGLTLTPVTNYTVTAATINGATSKKVFNVTISSDLFAGNTLDTHALTLVVKGSSVNDVAGNVNDAYSTSVVLVRDKVAPTFVSASAASNKETFEVKFNKAVTVPSDAASKIIVTDKDGVRYSVDSVTAKGSTGEDAKVLVVDLIAAAAPSQAMANGEYTLQFQSGAVTDSLSNASVGFTTKVVVGNSSDTTKPVVALDGSSAANSFVVNFGEEVTNTALSVANYTLDSKALPAGTAIYFTSTAKNQVKIELPEDSINIGTVASGTNAVLTVSNVKDLVGNTADTKNLSVLVKDNTSAVLLGAQIIGNNVLKLTFDENITSSLVVADVLAGLEIKSSVGTVVGTTATTTATAAGKDIIITFSATDNFDEVVAQTTTVKTLDGTPVNNKVEGIKDVNGLGAKANVSLTATR